MPKYVYTLDDPEKAKKKGLVGISHDGRGYKIDLNKPADFVLETTKMIPEPKVHGLRLSRTLE